MNCEYLIYCGNRGQNTGYYCTHPKIHESAKLYQYEKNKYITKSVDFVGIKEPKRCLNWCPKKNEIGGLTMPDWKQNAVKDLQEYEALQVSLHNIASTLKEIDISMTSTKSTSYDKSPVHGGGSGFEDRIINNIERKGRAIERYKIAHLRTSRIERGLAVLTENERLVLDRFFTNRERDHVGRLCEELGYEERNIYKIKDCALKKFTLAMFGVIDV